MLLLMEVFRLRWVSLTWPDVDIKVAHPFKKQFWNLSKLNLLKKFSLRALKKHLIKISRFLNFALFCSFPLLTFEKKRMATIFYWPFCKRVKLKLFSKKYHLLESCQWLPRLRGMPVFAKKSLFSASLLDSWRLLFGEVNALILTLLWWSKNYGFVGHVLAEKNWKNICKFDCS